METHSRLLLLSFKALLCFTILSTLWCMYYIYIDFNGVTPKAKSWTIAMLSLTQVYLVVAITKGMLSDGRIAIETYRHEVKEKCVTKGMLVNGFIMTLLYTAIVWLCLVLMAIIFVAVDKPYHGGERIFIITCLMGSLVVQCTLLYRLESLFDHKIPLLPL
jgi:ABC-type sugar transport system permease subunit